MKNKKANVIIEGLTIIVVLFVLAFASVYGLKLFDELNTDIQADDDIGATAKNLSSETFTKYPTLMDSVFLFAFCLLVIVTLALVFMLDTHPIFFIISVLLLGSLFIVGMIVSNTYDDMMSDDELSSYANQFPYTNWIITHLVELLIGIGFMITVVLFIKFQGG